LVFDLPDGTGGRLAAFDLSYSLIDVLVNELPDVNGCMLALTPHGLLVP
jgi:hypothetical protein